MELGKLKLPKETKVMKKYCLCNKVGVVIKSFDSEKELKNHLKKIQRFIN